MGMVRSLHTKDQKSEVVNRLNQRGTINLSPPRPLNKFDTLNSSNIKKAMNVSQSKDRLDKIDTERKL